jgi:hypothetical protein
MLLKDLNSIWSIVGFLTFLATAWPVFHLALQYHYSVKGSILSSGLGACFGGVLLFAENGRRGISQFIALLCPFAVTAIVYYLIPNRLGLLYALILSLSVLVMTHVQHTPSAAAGGRNELVAKFTALHSIQRRKQLQKFFFHWALFGVSSTLIHKIFQTQLAVYVPLLAFAVFAGSVQTSPVPEESR